MFTSKKISIVTAILFFIVGLATLPHYGINWDTINHLPRGQVYLRYLLTREKSVETNKEFKEFQQKEGKVKKESTPENPRYRLYQQQDSLFFEPNIPRNEVPRASYYDGSYVDFDYFMATDGDGHPPLSDILSSAFNVVLFQKLGLINDIDSYRTYGVLLSSLLIGLVFWWTAKAYGKFAGITAALSLALYPLFLSESHFNSEKDIPEAVYWSFMLFSIWRGVVFKKWKWILTSGIFLGLALGTKFNVIFSPLVVVPWLGIYLVGQYLKTKTKRKGKTFDWKLILRPIRQHFVLFASAVLAVLLGIAIFIGSWPYLWMDPLGGIERVVHFYKSIGTTAQAVDPEFLGPLGTNTYALQWILYTTPIVTLIFAMVGIVTILTKKRNEEGRVSLLFLLWLGVPILRGTWPGSNLYGGVRQIAEFVPALAIIAGLGASTVREILNKNLSYFAKRKWISGLLILAMFVPIAVKIIQIHPNENVYFNPLVGGLKGAKERNFPYWGNSFGAAYRQGVNWINKNAPRGSKLAYAYELMVNIPLIWFRSDLHFINQNRSGFLRRGEYVITLTYEGTNKRSYFDMYLDQIMEPAYTVDVDGVSIMKVWKNDEAHVRQEWRNEAVLEKISYEEKTNGILIDIKELRRLSRLEIDYDESKKCPKLTVGYIELSKNGKDWERVPGVLPDDWRVPVLGEQPNNGKFIEPFAGQEAQYISFVAQPTGTCVMNIKNVKLYYFK